MSARHRTLLPYVRDGICVVPRFLPDSDFARVQEDCRRLRARMKREKDSIATGRMGCFVDRRSETHALLTSGTVLDRVSRIVGQPMTPSDCPIELRAYRVGAHMVWHRDDQLYDVAQCEVVICLDNTSDSRTEWTDANGDPFDVWTSPNTALLVRGGETGAPHRVTPLKRGERTILKMVWTVPDSTPLPAFFEHLDAFPGLRRRVRKGLERSKSGKRR